MTKFEGSTFTNIHVDLDNNIFINCLFDHVTLIYSGGHPPTILGCRFKEPKIVFKGSAGNTVEFMTHLYHGGFQQIIEATLENIRKGTESIEKIKSQERVV